MHICFFDIDGTLILTGGAGQAAFELTFAEEFGVDRWTGDVAFSGRSDRAIVGDIFREYGIEASDSNWRRFSEAYLQRLPKTLAEREGRVLPGVSELLSTLGGRSDIAVGLLTGNTQAGANGKLSHFGIETHFDFGGFGDVHIDRNNIAAEALSIARGRFNVVDEVVVIGDTAHDVRCAQSIGAVAIAVSNGLSSAAELKRSNPDILLDDLTDATAVMERFQTCRR